VIDSAPTVRHAVAGDVEPVTDTLARAFDDDPVMAWLFPDDERRFRRSRKFFLLRMKQFLPQGDVYTTADRAGAAIWAVPGQWHLPALATLQMIGVLAPAVGPRGPRALRGMMRIDAAHPTEPHYYLAVLGTEPEFQGRGIGSALMRPVLDLCDRDEVPAYLESSKERNIAFYARHGFRVTREVTLPKGPPVWLMWRDPRP
jgi:ribosomal protein S18 acetylase RimI-like enzyme